MEGLDNTYYLWYTPDMQEIGHGNEHDVVTMINHVMTYPNSVEECLGRKWATPEDLVVVKNGKAYALLEILFNGELTLYSQDRIASRHREVILYAIQQQQRAIHA